MPKLKPINQVLAALNEGIKPVLITRKALNALPTDNLMRSYRSLLESKGISHALMHHTLKGIESCVSTIWTKRGLMVSNFYREWRVKH